MKTAIATRADNKNLPYFKMFEKSVKKFHPEIDIHLWDEDKIAKYNDPVWFYRASPIIAKEIINDYDLVLAMDCDQLVLGNLDHIINADYDIGTVLNVNRVDPAIYGVVSFQGLASNEYYNNGLVAIRNNDKGKEFLDEWDRLCHSKYFHRLQYREQDMLNILAHYGNYNVLCFDDYDLPNGVFTWNGLVAKGETIHSIMRNGEVIIPRGKDGYPDRDVVMKVWHAAGGQGPKMNYRTAFPEEVINFINSILL